MTIMARRDSAGNEWEVWAQRQPNSCAVASIWMARQQARQMCLAESEWELAWRIYRHTVQGIPWAAASSAGAPTGPMSIPSDSSRRNQSSFYNMFGSAGTFPTQIRKTLISDGFTASAFSATGPGQFPSMSLNASSISPSTPAIVAVMWQRQTGGQWVDSGGGHAIVAASRIGSNIVYLDPWGGQLYELPNNGRYTAGGSSARVALAIYVSA